MSRSGDFPNYPQKDPGAGLCPQAGGTCVQAGLLTPLPFQRPSRPASAGQ